jgi:RNA polymerase sigma-70 factor (ECF subfamily)
VALEALVEALSAERREAFVLTQLLGCSYEEAAVACDVPVGTIRSRVARARSDLTTALKAAEAS